MASKHHRSKATRSHGAYQRRLSRRGLHKAPVMPSLGSLRGKQLGSAERAELEKALPAPRAGT